MNTEKFKDIDNNSKITLLNVFGKDKVCYVQPLKQRNGLNFDFVKKVRHTEYGSEMILSHEDMQNPDRIYFIAEDEEIMLKGGVTFDLSNKLERNKWLAICGSELIAPSRNARDEDGNLIIDGSRSRYGVAEFYIDIEGRESQVRIEKTKLVHQAYQYVLSDSDSGRSLKVKLLGKNMDRAAAPDIEDYLLQISEKKPKTIIELYESKTNSIRLLILKAKSSSIIRSEKGLFMYGDHILGATDDTVVSFLAADVNSELLDLIKRDTYPEYYSQVVNNELIPDTTTVSGPPPRRGKAKGSE